MSIYYIDDSFFEKTDYARQMLYKLEVLASEQDVSKLLISTKSKDIEGYARYQEYFESLGIEVYFSTQVLFLKKEKLEITEYALQWNDQRIKTYAGTVVVLDEETCHWKRIYLDFFPSQETDLISLLQEVLEESIGMEGNEKLKS